MRRIIILLILSMALLVSADDRDINVGIPTKRRGRAKKTAKKGNDESPNIITLDNKARTKPKPMTEKDREEAQSNAPDPHKPQNRRILACTGCRAVAKELYKQLDHIYQLRHKLPKLYEYVEAMEKACQNVHDEYGLVVINNEPTLFFEHRSRSPYQARGTWITTMLDAKCGALTEGHEQALIAALPDPFASAMEGRRQRRQRAQESGSKDEQVNKVDDERDLSSNREEAFVTYVCEHLDGGCPPILDAPEDEEYERNHGKEKRKSRKRKLQSGITVEEI